MNYTVIFESKGNEPCEYDTYSSRAMASQAARALELDAEKDSVEGFAVWIEDNHA